MAGVASGQNRLRGDPTPLLELHARVQHVLLLGSVLVLASTGLPQKFDSLSASRWLMDSAGGIETLRLIHHVAGGVLIFACFYHVALVASAVLVQGVMTPLRMIPSARDCGDAVRTVRYFLGLSRKRAGLEEPTYFQKFDYWTLAWLLTVMGTSGLMRLFPVRMSSLLPADVVAAALRTHGDIAVLILAWVLIVHLAYSGLTPPLFVMRSATDEQTARAPAEREVYEPAGTAPTSQELER